MEHEKFLNKKQENTMKNKLTKTQIAKFISKIEYAFETLRDRGYICEHNFWCCQSCGWAALDDEAAKKAVFYHAQDMDDIKKFGTCHLCWSGDGEEILSALEEAGLGVTWDGTEDQRFCVRLQD